MEEADLDSYIEMRNLVEDLWDENYGHKEIRVKIRDLISSIKDRDEEI